MNFAESVCVSIAAKVGIPFYKDVVSAKNRQRVNPTFSLNEEITENNIIVYDDIITTGSTIDAVNKLLPEKNCIYIIGINNN